MSEKVRYAEYKRRGYVFTKDGHDMFHDDVVRDLNRKSFLESELVNWKNNHADMVKRNAELSDRPDLKDRAKSIDSLRERITELEEALRLCQHHSNYSIGESEALAAQLTKIRVITNITLTTNSKGES